MVQYFTSIDLIEKVRLIQIEIQNWINHLQIVGWIQSVHLHAALSIFFYLRLNARTSTLKWHKDSTWLKEPWYNMQGPSIYLSDDSSPGEYINTLCMVAHNLAGYKPKMIKSLAARFMQPKVLKGPLNIGTFEFSVVKQRVQTAASYKEYEEEKN